VRPFLKSRHEQLESRRVVFQHALDEASVAGGKEGPSVHGTILTLEAGGR
jgi:hypothetical protein